MNPALDAARELERAVAQGEQRVVLATADVLTRMEVGAALADDDLAVLMDSPANFLTPRRLEWESRPLRVEPKPFLCAM